MASIGRSQTGPAEILFVCSRCDSPRRFHLPSFEHEIPPEAKPAELPVIYGLATEVLIDVVDDDPYIERLLPILDEMLTGGALGLSNACVRVLKYAAARKREDSPCRDETGVTSATNGAVSGTWCLHVTGQYAESQAALPNGAPFSRTPGRLRNDIIGHQW